MLRINQLLIPYRGWSLKLHSYSQRRVLKLQMKLQLLRKSSDKTTSSSNLSTAKVSLIKSMSGWFLSKPLGADLMTLLLVF